MKTLKISTKLFISHATLGLLITGIISFTFYIIVRNALIQRTIDQLSSINILKKAQIDDHFKRSQRDLEAMQIENLFVNFYQVISNQTGADNKEVIKVEHEISDILNLYDFKSLVLLDSTHNKLFSMKHAQLSPELIMKIDSIVHPKRYELQVVDASIYSPSGETLIFYYVPIVNDSLLVGSVLIQENFNKIQKILLETTGMGNTGESYIVANDYRMRSSSRFFPDTPGLSIRVETDAVKNSFHNIQGNHIIIDYRNEKVLSFSRQLENKDLTWSIISEIDFSEAMEPIIRLRNYLIFITIAVVVATLLITFILSQAIAQPILQLKNIVESLSKGIIPAATVMPVTTTFEISQIAQAINQLTEGLKQTSAFANEIGSGNFNTTFKTLSDQDTLGLALIRMRDELRKFNDREVRLERERAAALLKGQENERKRIIAELHDGVGQMLTAIRMRVDMLVDPAKDEIKTHINEVIAEVKRISYNVMPQALVHYGLEPALKGLCDDIKKYSLFTIDFRYVKEFEHKLDFEMSIAIFRIAQEGLNNIMKHAEATHINFHVLDKEDEIYIVIEDNGKGFNSTDLSKAGGSGLRNIRERAKLLFGNAAISSIIGSGTTIEVHIPIPTNSKNV